MLQVGDRVTSPRGTVIEVLESSPERLRVRRTLPPNTGKGAPHRHDNWTERFRVIEGSLSAKVGRSKRALEPGDVMEVPVSTVHIHPHTDAGMTAVYEQEIEPRTAYVEAYLPRWARWLEEGKVDRQDEPTLLGIAAITAAGDGATWVPGIPMGMQKLAARGLAPLARRRGYGGDLDPG